VTATPPAPTPPAPTPPAAAQSLPAPAPLLPLWAESVRRLFVSGAASQFLLYGSVLDLVPTAAPDGTPRFLPLRQFLEDVLLAPFEVVLFYDRGKGLRVRRGGDLFQKWLKIFDSYQGTAFADGSLNQPDDPGAGLEKAQLLPREPRRALELADRFLRAGLHRTRVTDGGERVADPVRTAIVLDYAHYLVPQADAIYLAGEPAEHLIRVLDWATDPALMASPVVTCLIAPNLHDLNRQVVECAYTAKVPIALPSEREVADYARQALVDIPGGADRLELPVDAMAAKLVGLSRANIRSLLLRTVGTGARLTASELSSLKKELIEKECQGLLDFVESPWDLDRVAGHQAAKQWLRDDARLLKSGAVRALPMGYLVTGRIGTGKTFLIECWAGELGIPMVELKNFRDKWVGATEGNLETIFRVLKALGQVVVFVDEADQATGRRGGGGDGDSGLSGRVYSMLAQEMADTRNRGKIVWVFATSRPDLLEVDLKRQGRLDVHIPLFPPQDEAGRRELFMAMAKKLKLPAIAEDFPQIAGSLEIGGNEIEGLLVRCGRLHALAEAAGKPRALREIAAEVFGEFRPSAHQERLELMDLLAVEECTDSRFLPPRFRDMPLDQVRRRRAELQRFLLG
jgi:AAA+ superfamily predicted ATPase